MSPHAALIHFDQSQATALDGFDKPASPDHGIAEQFAKGAVLGLGGFEGEQIAAVEMPAAKPLDKLLIREPARHFDAAAVDAVGGVFRAGIDGEYHG